MNGFDAEEGDGVVCGCLYWWFINVRRAVRQKIEMRYRETPLVGEVPVRDDKRWVRDEDEENRRGTRGAMRYVLRVESFLPRGLGRKLGERRREREVSKMGERRVTTTRMML